MTTKELTTQEIHMIICIMQGHIPNITGKDAIFLKRRGVNDHEVLFKKGNFLQHKKLFGPSIELLAAQRLIILVSPPYYVKRKYIGQWIINFPQLRMHPQYTEIRVQAALGT